MARSDVGKALEAMGDDAVRQRLGTGDFSAVDALDLTNDERSLLQDAAQDFPEVAGFAVDAFIWFNTGQPDHAQAELSKFRSSSPRFVKAVEYFYATGP